MVFVTSEENGDVAVIDTKTRKVLVRIKTGPRPRSVTFSKDGAIAFVPSETAGLISIIDVPKRKVTSTIKLPAIEGAPTPPRPMGGVLSPDGSQLFMSLGRARFGRGDRRGEPEAASNDQRYRCAPWGVTLSEDGSKLYTANGPSGDVSIVDVASGKVEKKVSTGGSPWGVVVVEKK